VVPTKGVELDHASGPGLAGYQQDAVMADQLQNFPLGDQAIS
jgi:hypothetical protein